MPWRFKGPHPLNKIPQFSYILHIPVDGMHIIHNITKRFRELLNREGHCAITKDMEADRTKYANEIAETKLENAKRLQFAATAREKRACNLKWKTMKAPGNTFSSSRIILYHESFRCYY